jgi:hypothetical protein
LTPGCRCISRDERRLEEFPSKLSHVGVISIKFWSGYNGCNFVLDLGSVETACKESADM